MRTSPLAVVGSFSLPIGHQVASCIQPSSFAACKRSSGQTFVPASVKWSPSVALRLHHCGREMHTRKYCAMEYIITKDTQMNIEDINEDSL